MRALSVAVLGAVLGISCAAQAQVDGPVGGKVGPNLDSPALTPPGASSAMQPYGVRPRTGPTAGYAGAVSPGQVVPEQSPVIVRPGGFGTAFVNGHRVLVDPGSRRIQRIIN
jgi:hypothetical protein